MANHRAKGYRVSQPGSKSVSYPKRAQAKRVASQLKGAKVRKNNGCPISLLLLPYHILRILLRKMR